MFFYSKNMGKQVRLLIFVRRGGSTTSLQFDGFNMQLSQVFRGTWRSDVRHLPFACLIFAKPDFSGFNIYIYTEYSCVYICLQAYIYIYIYAHIFTLYTFFSIDEIGFMMGNSSYQTPSFSVLPLISTKTSTRWNGAPFVMGFWHGAWHVNDAR